MLVQDTDYRVKLAAQDLIQQINDDGSFVYKRDRQGQTVDVKYNMLRHCGTIWALNSCIRHYDMTHWQPALDRAIGFLIRNTVNCESSEVPGGFTLMLDEKQAKLGGNALAILALLNVAAPDHAFIAKLNAGLQFFFEKPDYAIRFSKFNPYNGEVSPFNSEYYPGEAALALSALQQQVSALALIRHTRDNRDKEKVLQDHWMLQALGSVYFADSASDLVVTKAIRQELLLYAENIYLQMREEPYYVGKCTPTACRIEGLVPYLKMLRHAGLTQDYLRVYDFTDSLVQDLTNYQVLTGPAAGAFFETKSTRIDYSQHAISALLGFSQLSATT